MHKICKEQDAWLHNTRRNEHTCVLHDRKNKTHDDSLADCYSKRPDDTSLSGRCHTKRYNTIHSCTYHDAKGIFSKRNAHAETMMSFQTRELDNLEICLLFLNIHQRKEKRYLCRSVRIINILWILGYSNYRDHAFSYHIKKGKILPRTFPMT